MATEATREEEDEEAEVEEGADQEEGTEIKIDFLELININSDSLVSFA